jgi:hypothetical protein
MAPLPYNTPMANVSTNGMVIIDNIVVIITSPVPY